MSEAQPRQGGRTYLSEMATREGLATVKHAGECHGITGSTAAERPSACARTEVPPKDLIHLGLRAVPNCDCPLGQTVLALSDSEASNWTSDLWRWVQLDYSPTAHGHRAAPL